MSNWCYWTSKTFTDVVEVYDISLTWIQRPEKQHKQKLEEGLLYLPTFAININQT